MEINMEKLLVDIVIMVLLYYTFKHITMSGGYMVRGAVPWNNRLYGKANSRSNKRVPLPYPQLYGNGPKVPNGTPGWLI